MAQQYAFGVGRLYGIRLDATAPPIQFGTLQDVSVDIDLAVKELYGQLQMPVAIARGQGKVTGKAKTARINAQMFNDLFFGLTGPVAGQNLIVGDEVHTIPATPFQITVAPPNSGTFVADLGVYYTATGVQLAVVTSSPATGQYSVSAAGVYTFAAADTGLGVAINYEYSVSTGKTLTLANQYMGSGPTFKILLSEQFNAQGLVLQLNKCVASKLSLPAKLEDWVIPELDFSAMDDGTGNWGVLYNAT